MTITVIEDCTKGWKGECSCRSCSSKLEFEEEDLSMYCSDDSWKFMLTCPVCGKVAVSYDYNSCAGSGDRPKGIPGWMEDRVEKRTRKSREWLVNNGYSGK